MTKEQTEYYRKKMIEKRAEEDKLMQDIAKEDMLRHRNVAIQTSERCVKFEGKKSPNQIYEDWLKKYKEKNPDFKEDENNFKADKNGNGWINFKDPEAEEDFVRHLAANQSHGGILDKGILIAKFEDGKLIDPRTNHEFPEGEYAKLVQKLDSGIAYNDIPLSKPTAPTPFTTTPY